MITSKLDLIKSKENGTLIPRNLENSIRKVIRTSGSTGKPLLIYLNDIDIEVITDIGAKCFLNSGVTPGMKVVHCFNQNLWAGGCIDNMSLSKAKACVYEFGVGHTEALIDLILSEKIEAISCTPSYMTRLAEVIKMKFGLSPKDLGLKLCLFGGEGGVQNPEFRKMIETIWGAEAIDANYGSADTISMFASENYLTKDGLIFLAPEYIKCNLLINGELQDIEVGKIGSLVISTKYTGGLIKRINYNTNDVIEILEVNSDGTFRFKVLGRDDDMVVVKGLNIYSDTFKRAIEEVSNEFGDQLQVQMLVSKNDPITNICFKIHYCNDYDNDNFKNITNECIEKIKLSTNISNFEIKMTKDFLDSDTGKVKNIVRCL